MCFRSFKVLFFLCQPQIFIPVSCSPISAFFPILNQIDNGAGGDRSRGYDDFIGSLSKLPPYSEFFFFFLLKLSLLDLVPLTEDFPIMFGSYNNPFPSQSSR